MTKRKATTKLTGNKSKSRRKVAMAEVEGAFEEAFGHVDPDRGLAAAGNDGLDNSDEHDADMGFALSRGDVDRIMDEEELDEEAKEDENNYNEENIGFGNADYFDVKDVLELSDKVGPASLNIIDDLKDNCISQNSKTTYTSSLVLFLTYIYRYDTHLLHNSWIKTIKTFSFGIQNEKQKEKAEKKTIKKLLMNGDNDCPPLDFGSYSAQHFMKYLLSLQTKDGERLGLSSYNSRRSALFHLFRKYGAKQESKFGEELAILFRGLKRKIAVEKQDGDGRIQTGKSPMPFAVYERLNYYLLLEKTTEAVFCRAFLCLTWNLMCRSRNTCTIHLHHIEWQDDCMQIYFAHMKNDQTAERHRDPRHIYANPINPLVCPMLALATYLSVFSISGGRDSSLFPGDNQYKRFTKYMDSLMENYKEDICRDFGIDVKFIGSHSIRKGAATFVSSGATCSPPQVATNIRAGWTMGVVQDTYLRYESAGDQYVGRVVAGLPICSAKFSVLPPQFDCCMDEVDEMRKSCFPHLPDCMICCCRYLAATLVCHLNFLEKFTTPTHPLQCLPCFTSPIIKQMRKSVLVLYAYEESNVEINIFKSHDERSEDVMLLHNEPNETQDSPTEDADAVGVTNKKMVITKATGIPPHVMLLANMQLVISSQHKFIDEMRNAINEEFDKRHMASNSFEAKNQLERSLSEFEKRLLLTLNLEERSGHNKESSTSEVPGGGIWYNWGGKFSRVPITWEFPNKVSLRNIWHRWFLCNHDENVCPLRELRANDVRMAKNGRRNLSSLRTLMNFMIEKAKAKGVYKEHPNKEEVEFMFKEVSGSVFSLLPNKRSEGFSWHSFTNRVAKERRRLKALQ